MADLTLGKLGVMPMKKNLMSILMLLMTSLLVFLSLRFVDKINHSATGIAEWPGNLLPIL